MRLTLDALIVLDAIDRKGSFAAAADEMHRVPSAISYTIQKLEQDLDLLLFDRTGHRATLTPAGRELLEQGRHLLRAANAVEARVKRVATGWEAELTIAFEALVPLENGYPAVEKFYAETNGTRLRLSQEVLGGAWESLATGRADLVIGATGEGPSSGGYSTHVLGTTDLVFVVARGHPLASAHEPLSDDTLQQHRAIAIADTSRNLAPRSAGLISGQDVLTVPDMAAKLEAHRRGLGVGHVPRTQVQQDLDEGSLIAKAVEGGLNRVELLMAWRSDHRGKALTWFVQHFKDPATASTLLQAHN